MPERPNLTPPHPHRPETTFEEPRKNESGWHPSEARVQALQDEALLAILLRDTEQHMSDLLASNGGLPGLLHVSTADLQRLLPEQRTLVFAFSELNQRLAQCRIPKGKILQRPGAVATYLRLRYSDPHQEVVGALYLDTSFRLIAEAEIFRGTLALAPVEPRPLFARALACGAVYIVLFHTHPSGDPRPSPSDIAFTQRMVDIGELMGIRLLDHIILGPYGHWLSVIPLDRP